MFFILAPFVLNHEVTPFFDKQLQLNTEMRYQFLQSGLKSSQWLKTTNSNETNTFIYRLNIFNSVNQVLVELVCQTSEQCHGSWK